MNRMKNVDFNLFKANVKVRAQAELITVLAQEIAQATDMDEQKVHALICARFSQCTFSFGDDLILFDMTAVDVRKPVMGMITFENTIQFENVGSVHSGIMAVVVSSNENVPEHLQKVAATSRILRDKDLRTALHEAESEEVIELLLMPRYKRADAA